MLFEYWLIPSVICFTLILIMNWRFSKGPPEKPEWFYIVLFSIFWPVGLLAIIQLICVEDIFKDLR